MEIFNLRVIDITLWTILMFIVMVVMIVFLITHIVIYRDKQQDLQYKLDSHIEDNRK